MSSPKSESELKAGHPPAGTFIKFIIKILTLDNLLVIYKIFSIKLSRITNKIFQNCRNLGLY